MRNKKERLGEVSVEQTEFVCVCAHVYGNVRWWMDIGCSSE